MDTEDIREDKKIETKNNIVFNYSHIELTPAMQKLLNRALNFAVLPHKLDSTQLLVDFNRFARSTIWQEYWFGKESEEKRIQPQYSKRENIKYPKTTQHQQG